MPSASARRAEIEEDAAELRERLRVLEQRRARQPRPQNPRRTGTASQAVVPTSDQPAPRYSRVPLQTDFHLDAEALRQGIILSEILRPPLALRPPTSGMWDE